MTSMKPSVSEQSHASGMQNTPQTVRCEEEALSDSLPSFFAWRSFRGLNGMTIVTINMTNMAPANAL